MSFPSLRPGFNPRLAHKYEKSKTNPLLHDHQHRRPKSHAPPLAFLHPKHKNRNQQNTRQNPKTISNVRQSHNVRIRNHNSQSINPRTINPLRLRKRKNRKPRQNLQIIEIQRRPKPPFNDRNTIRKILYKIHLSKIFYTQIF